VRALLFKGKHYREKENLGQESLHDELARKNNFCNSPKEKTPHFFENVSNIQ
jgi:hypothetical protein